MVKVCDMRYGGRNALLRFISNGAAAGYLSVSLIILLFPDPRLPVGNMDMRLAKGLACVLLGEMG